MTACPGCGIHMELGSCVRKGDEFRCRECETELVIKRTNPVEIEMIEENQQIL